MIKVVIFDLWNTLIDPTHSNHALKEIEKTYNIPKKIYQTTVKKGLMTTPLHTTDDVNNYLKKEFGFNHVTREQLNNLDKIIEKDKIQVELFEDAIPTLECLSKDGYKIALISNAATFHKHPFYKFNLEKYFDYVCFSCDVGFWKPETEIYKLTLKELGLKPCETIMVGDNREKDALVPSTLGMMGLHLDRDKKYPRTIQRIDSLYELTEIVKEKN